MIFVQKLPFVTLRFKNASQEHKDFFDNLFFEQSDTPSKVLVEVNFVKKFLIQEQLELEKKSIATSRDFYIKDLLGNKVKLNFDTFNRKKIILEAEKKIDLYYLFTLVIEPLIVIWSAQHDVLYLHASSLEKHGEACIFPAWKNTGKTNTVLSMHTQGYNFLADDYSVVYQGNAYLYAKSFNIFSYNFARFPRLLKNIGLVKAARVTVVGFVRKLLDIIGKKLSGALGKALLRISALAEVATNIKVTPSILGVPIGRKSKLNKVLLLQKSNFKSTKVQHINKQEAVNKITLTVQGELAHLVELSEHFSYFFPHKKLPTNLISFSKNYKRLALKEIKKPKLVLLSSTDASQVILDEL